MEERDSEERGNQTDPIIVADNMTQTETSVTDVSTNTPVNEQLPKNLFVALLGLILDLTGLFLIDAIMPSILQQYDIADKDGLYPSVKYYFSIFEKFFNVPKQFSDMLLSGLLDSVFSMIQFFILPIIGHLCDVYGRKAVMLKITTGTILSYVILTLSNQFEICLVARMLGALSHGQVSITAAIVADLCSPQLRCKGMALLGVACSASIILGSIIKYILHTKVGTEIVLFAPIVAIGLSSLHIITLLLFKESLPKEKRRGHFSKKAVEHLYCPFSTFFFNSIQKLGKADATLLLHVGYVFLQFTILSRQESTFVFFMHQRFAYSRSQTMFSIHGLIMALTQGLFLQKIDAGEEMKIAIYGITSIIVAFLLVAVSHCFCILCLGLFLYSSALAMIESCLLTCISRCGSDDQKGLIIANFKAVGFFAQGLGPFFMAVGFFYFGATLFYLLIATLMLLPLKNLHYIQHYYVQYRVKRHKL